MIVVSSSYKTISQAIELHNRNRTTTSKERYMIELLNALAPFAPSFNYITLLICLIIAKRCGVLPQFS